uniref:Uncharacterized protein n=1 Tax=Romanomermis culicivorax TaxID=13658 RepID=A0A915J3E1_ROMCU
MEKTYRVWFFSPIKNRCLKTKPQSKDKNDIYYMSKKECKESAAMTPRFKTCHKIVDGTCQQVPEDQPCNLLEYSFHTPQDCMECLNNYDNQNIAFMTHKGSICGKTDFNHPFLYLHCSMAQCLYRQNLTNNMVSVKEFGPYYMRWKCAKLVDDEHPGQIYMFRSKEECMKKYNEDKELREKSVGYRYRLGDCRETMDLKSPGFYKTLPDCRFESHKGDEQYLIDTMSFCVREKSWYRERSRRPWFRTLDECKEYLDHRAKTKTTYLERSYGEPTFFDHPLHFIYRGASRVIG